MIDNYEIKNKQADFTDASDTQAMPGSLAHALENCQKDKNELLSKLQDLQHKYAYLNADFDNFRRRTTKDYENIRTDAYTKVFKSLITIIDDFDRALPTLSTCDQFEGFSLIRKSFDKLLSQFGIEPMTIDGTFDPEKHEALMHVESKDHASGTIIEVLEKGYTINGTILRPAKVSVAA